MDPSLGFNTNKLEGNQKYNDQSDFSEINLIEPNIWDDFETSSIHRNHRSWSLPIPQANNWGPSSGNLLLEGKSISNKGGDPFLFRHILPQLTTES